MSPDCSFHQNQMQSVACPHGGPNCLIYHNKSDGLYAVCTIAADDDSWSSDGANRAMKKAGGPVGFKHGVLSALFSNKCKFQYGQPIKIT